MPLDTLPGKLVTLSRDQRRDRYRRDFSLRNPTCLVGENTQPYLDGSVFADVTEGMVANAIIIANSVTRATATGPALDDWAIRLGTSRLPPVGGAGAVSITASSGGTFIFAGDVITFGNVRFRCTASNTYGNATQVPISGLDTGPSTNLPAGSLLTWQAPRPGCGPTATVVLQTDSTGTSGGSLVESDDQLRSRLDGIAANPPASGNSAQYQAVIATTPLLSVQQGFTFPCIKGPGSKGVTFTLRPSQPGANRIPNATQLAQLAVNLQGQMPADDGVYLLAIIPNATVVVLKTLWATGAPAWSDAQQWPTYIASPNLVSVATPFAGTTSPTFFRLDSTTITSPAIGQSIAFFDLPNLTFRRKKILSFVADGTHGWDITVDTTNGISDVTYTPVIGQACCPWSDSLSTLIPSVVAYFDLLGPGEQTTNFFDPGLRMKRSPVSPLFWPNVITNRMLGGTASPTPASASPQNLPPIPTLLTTPSLQDVVLVEPVVPFATHVGALGINVNLLTLGNLVAFPE